MTLLGPVAPWIAVVVSGITVVVNRGRRRESTGWMVMVLRVAYAAQVLGDLLYGGVLSAFIGALVAIALGILTGSALLSRFRPHPPALL